MEDEMHAKRKPTYQSRSPQPTSAHRDAWYEAPFYDSVLPAEFFDSRVKLTAVCPETALMYAVLENAFLCFHKQFESGQRFMQGARQAEEWFFSDDFHWLFSFVSICDALGLEPRYIRLKLKHWTPLQLDTAPATR
jgi:hypothetical protein